MALWLLPTLSPFRWEKAVEAVYGESVAFRYSSLLSNVLIVGASAVAAAQLAQMASCAEVRSLERVLVIPPCCWSLLFEFLGLRLWLLEPVGDLVPFLLPGRLLDLRDEGVLVRVCCASKSDLSVMSSILGAVCIGPSRGIQIDESSAFHSVRGVSRLLFPYQSCSSNFPYRRLPPRCCCLRGKYAHLP